MSNIFTALVAQSVERLLRVQEVVGSSTGRVIHKTLKFEILLPRLALGIKGTEYRLVHPVSV